MVKVPPRGPDKKKRHRRNARNPCPHPIITIHQHLDWYGEEFGFKPAFKPIPVSFRQGSTAKLEEMRRRADCGEELFCDGDDDARD